MTEVKQAVASMSMDFEVRYGQRWVYSNDIDDREALQEKLYKWVDELVKENLSAVVITRATAAIMASTEFAERPPVLNKFIQICKELTRIATTGKDGKLYLAIKKMDEQFQFIYGRLWLESDKDRARRKIEMWQTEIGESGISEKTIITAVKVIGKSGAYHTYPPNLNQFIMECLFIEMGERYVDPDIAFLTASQQTHDETIHAVLESTIGIIGSFRLKSATDRSIKQLFEKVYAQECLSYCEDKEAYIAKVQSGKSDGIEAQFSDEEVASNNVEFLQSLMKKDHP